MNSFMSNNIFDYMNKIVEFHLDNSSFYYFKYLNFFPFTIICSYNALISDVIENFKKKINIKNINWIFTKGWSRKYLNLLNTVKVELGFEKDIYVYVQSMKLTK